MSSLPANQPQGRGRRTLLTPAVQEEICKWIRGGNYFKIACAMASIDENTAMEWIRRGDGTDERDDPTGIYANFANAVREARTQTEVQSVLRIRQAARDGDWRADTWWLERTAPDRWGRRNTTVLEGNPESPIVLSAAPPPEHARGVLEAMKRLEAGSNGNS